MTGIHIKVGLRYQYKGATFLIRKCIGNDHLQVEDLQFGEQRTIPLQWLLEAHDREELRFERPPLRTKARRDRPQRPEDRVPDFTRLPIGPLRDETKRRYRIMQRVEQLPPEQRNRKGFQILAEELKAKVLEDHPHADLKKRRSLGQAISVYSIERWWKDYEATGGDTRALIPELPACGGKGKKRTDPEVESIIAERFEFYIQNPKERSLWEIKDDLQDQIDEANKDREPDQQLELPDDSTIYRRIQEAGALLLVRGRRSRSKAKQDGPVYPGPKAMWILQRVEIDHTGLPFLLVDEADRLPIGFPTLTAAIDAYSGYILGIYVGFEPPDYLAIQNCLLHAILRKKDTRELFGTQHQWVACGVPELLVTDQGHDYTGTSLEDACEQMGIALLPLPGRSPWLKGKIERFFRTIIKRLGAQIPGSVSKLTSIFDETYDPKKHACISLTDFWHILHLYLVDEYAHKPHKGVQGVPYLLWMEDVQAGRGPALPWSAKEVRDLLRSSTHPRKIGRKGIEFEMLYYNSPELEALRSAIKKRAPRRVISTETNEAEVGKVVDEEELTEKVAVKYDPGDLSAIYVWSPIHNGGTWLRVGGIDQEYTQGLTFWKHQVIRRYLTRQQKEIDSASLRTARKEIQKIVDRAVQLKKQSTRGRKKAARYNGKGIQPAPSVDMTDGLATSIPASSPNTAMSASAVPGEPQFVVIGSPSTTPVMPGGSTDRRNSPEQPTSPTGRKPRTPRKKFAESIQPPPPTPEPQEVDMTGWGGDYDLPKPLSSQR